ncbi:hypothetical protein STRTUCAR8_09338, partial [Streptomyces turgidiscabies Car8]
MGARAPGTRGRSPEPTNPLAGGHSDATGPVSPPRTAGPHPRPLPGPDSGSPAGPRPGTPAPGADPRTAGPGPVADPTTPGPRAGPRPRTGPTPVLTQSQDENARW